MSKSIVDRFNEEKEKFDNSDIGKEINKWREVAQMAYGNDDFEYRRAMDKLKKLNLEYEWSKIDQK